MIEDMDFQFTTTSLNDAYEISYRHALELIEKNGGEIGEEMIKIKKLAAKVAPLEQNFQGYKLHARKAIDTKITSSDKQELELEFNGIGVVLTGRAKHEDYESKYALISDEETMNGHKINVEFYIDGELTKCMDLPLYFIERAHELFYQYEIPDGQHTLKLKITNPTDKAYLQIGDLITYEKE